ncbi:hypothetical protein ALC56_11387, partial [Trachymyrmex septentrionalis]
DLARVALRNIILSARERTSSSFFSFGFPLDYFPVERDGRPSIQSERHPRDTFSFVVVVVVVVVVDTALRSFVERSLINRPSRSRTNEARAASPSGRI